MPQSIVVVRQGYFVYSSVSVSGEAYSAVVDCLSVPFPCGTTHGGSGASFLLGITIVNRGDEWVPRHAVKRGVFVP